MTKRLSVCNIDPVTAEVFIQHDIQTWSIDAVKDDLI